MLIPGLESTASRPIQDYQVGEVVQVVNQLLPLGKDRALDEIDTFYKSISNQEQAHGLFWVLRALFDLPTGQSFPPVHLGQPDIPPPDNAALLPRFPLVILQDVPLLVVGGYVLAGLPETPGDHIQYFRSYGRLRLSPLQLPGNPQSLLAEFEQIWRLVYGSDYLEVVSHRIKAQIAHS